MTKTALHTVNGITLYRIFIVPMLLVLIVWHHWTVFRWLLILSFLTDAIDGYLARKYRVVTKAGATLDSIGDDLTVLVAIIGLFIFRPSFIRQQTAIIIVLVALYLLTVITALVKYGKLTAYHTWLAKIAAFLQATFLMLFFFLPYTPITLFLIASIFTAADLIEEFAMTLLLPRWRPDVRGIYSLLRKAKSAT
ncbi:MAG TPA: CDP-alcohol phosphatidyltransferase family protein [Dinghuibacter sp.]|uniref:CDP-alcohol phosphatidyltransferase family protein n=1 Tax=Dinghuibacter sp. TaxID=2024697 RepID=UPI002CDF4289|nr:CDP-alcohol phosphatidyltransferase family protein [Dinghuibacter sp.]HTJ12619.1 CDP-alcohol phosphatidyltransferase family protein [Dinghuibacter sp.]